MASGNESFSARAGSFDKLHEDGMDVLRDAKARVESHDADQEARNRRVAQLMIDQTAMPMTVNEVNILGGNNIRRPFLNPIVQPLLADQPGAPSTVGEVLAKLQDASGKLSALQILREPPEVFLQQSDPTDASSNPTDVNVSFSLKELPRFKLQTGTDVGNGEGSAYGSLLWRNVFGGAEMLTLNARSGTRTRSAYSATLAAPVRSDPGMRVSLEALASAAEKPWASHEEVLKGGSLSLFWLSGGSGGAQQQQQRDSHTLEYSGLWRQVTGLGRGASATVREDAGDSVKSALKHTFLRDRRDNPQLPQSGYMVRSRFELAGVGPLGGDVAFSKSELELGGALPVPLPGTSQKSGISIGGGFRMGMLWPLPLGLDFNGKAQPSRINDRFQLGGPADVRGFQLGGLGPHDGKDSVGGDLFAAGSVNMLLPLPYKGPESGLRFQLFANGGRLVALKNPSRSKSNGEGAAAAASSGLSPAAVREGMLNAVGSLLNGAPSAAAGVGLVYAHPVARFELNFSLPLVIRRGEVGTKGLQLGVGINLL
ncbi:outer membrane protein [Cordyceps fumosorosea ARSEF 2679]|uniref:Outer membrane protein n=1 Tax=Cordyceps fumosorosea (strain ARSEF 2679) TaxID=1081104 RepID=A0A168BW39_CORFA|nr:outer membrane protein [Cordyceps fumosorosea ARSEF 2679]OAA70621.1 outer membrane protein [Cordyceps fumosorosea ARSEF 2679]